MSSIFSTPTGIDYFDNLPGPAFSTVQSAFDRAEGKMGKKFILTSFNKDMLAMGYDRVSEKDMNRFIAGVEIGLFQRPERAGIDAGEGVDEDDDAVSGDVAEEALLNEEAIAVAEEIALMEADPVNAEATQSETFLIAGAPATDTQAFTIALLIRDATEELKQDLELQARKLVAQRLREMADAVYQG